MLPFSSPCVLWEVYHHHQINKGHVKGLKTEDVDRLESSCQIKMGGITQVKRVSAEKMGADRMGLWSSVKHVTPLQLCPRQWIIDLVFVFCQAGGIPGGKNPYNLETTMACGGCFLIKLLWKANFIAPPNEGNESVVWRLWEPTGTAFQDPRCVSGLSSNWNSGAGEWLCEKLWRHRHDLHNSGVLLWHGQCHQPSLLFHDMKAWEGQSPSHLH